MASLGAIALWFVLRVPTPPRPYLPFPPGKQCVLSITDDTDYFQFATTKPVYDLLNRFGARVTKTVWVFDDPKSTPEKEGLSLTNRTYKDWVLEQKRYGHEITLHSAASGDDPRDRTLAAYDSLEAMLGELPRLEIFHKANKEAFYWGAERLPSGVLRRLYEARMSGRFEGNKPESEYYWVDRARSLIRYVRTYTFNDIDTWAVNPSMPYEDPSTPEAPLWFASSNGRWGQDFVRLATPANLDRLKEAHGVSIIYVHLATGFDTPEAMSAMARCAGDADVEFVPAGELLDRLRLIQRVRTQLDQGTDRIRVPEALRNEFALVSVQPQELGTVRGVDGKTLPSRLSLQDWLERVDVEVEWTNDSIFAEPEVISRWEKWRLVAKWLWTQVATPT